MGIEVALSVIQTLLTALQCSDQVTQFSSIFWYKPKLDQLRGTIDRIKAVLVDAEKKEELSEEEKTYIEELKDALYEADDLFDEFLTLVQLKKLTQGFIDRYFSVFKKSGFAFRMSRKVAKIQSKLSAISSNNQLIRSEHLIHCKYDPEPILKRRPETCSYVRAVDIIGRDADLETIVGVLLGSDGEQDVSFLSIVGIGGLGKTALAQLVYNDHRVTSAFSLKLWTCISDLGQRQLDIEGILRKILASISGEKNEGVTLDRLQKDIREKLATNRFLLVLDDLWTEDREQWSTLTSFLLGGQKGSWILVTTRSRETASIMDGGSTHELQGLSREDSWRLFEVVTFGNEEGNPRADLLEIGREIVVRCANVPLAIRVMGSLLYGKDKRDWLLIYKHGLIKMEHIKKNGIIPILKLSYQQLEYPLKSCFVHCALFPKDYVIEKKTLMRLWMAQGYIKPDDLRNMDDVAEEFFTVLLRRCFFQDIVEDVFGDIESCKLHDLMHDVAMEVAGKEIFMSDTISGDMDKKACHVHLTSNQPTNYTFTKSSIRTYLQKGGYFKNIKIDKHSLDTLLDKWKYLRVLCLIKLHVESLPSSIGCLLHLRYLDLSSNSDLELLPKGITKLYNLQTLILRYCSRLKKLPEDMSKLVNLRVLDIQECDKLSCMPIDIGKLDCLQQLTMFVVGEADSKWDKYLKSLEDLKALRNLKGFLYIKIECYKKENFVKTDGGGGYLLNKEHLNHVVFDFTVMGKQGRVENDEVVIQGLQPHSNVKQLDMKLYKGVRTPEWWQEVNLANIVKLQFESCPNLKCLGCIGKLNNLKQLYLYDLQNLEFLIEKNTNDDCDVAIGLRSFEFSFFPSLETLQLYDLPKLKGWWNEVGMPDHLFQLPKLTQLKFHDCPDLVVGIECPILGHLAISKVNRKLGIKIIKGNKDEKEKRDEGEKLGEPTENVASSSYHPLKLKEVLIGSLKWLNSLQQMEAFQCIHSLKIYYDKVVESLGEGEELFRSCSSSLRSLSIYKCSQLRSLSGGLEHLTALETLSIEVCPNLRLEEEEEEEREEGSGSGSGLPWKSLNHSLRTLYLWQLPQMVNLPNWIHNLTALHTLHIDSCKELKSLPNWMSNLTSLRELRITYCSNTLEERCRQLTGEDWPHIKHIPSIDIS